MRLFFCCGGEGHQGHQGVGAICVVVLLSRVVDVLVVVDVLDSPRATLKKRQARIQIGKNVK